MVETVIDWKRPHTLHEGDPFLTPKTRRRQQPLTALESVDVYPVMLGEQQALGPSGSRRKAWALEGVIKAYIDGLGDRRIKPHFIYSDNPTPKTVQQSLWERPA